MAKFVSKLMKLLTPAILKQAVMALLRYYGVGLAGLQGFILKILIKIGVKKAANEIHEAADAIRDHANETKYVEVINDPKSTEQEKIKAELDLLNGR